jgi:hypothetical protein
MREMIANMSPVLLPGEFVYCTTVDKELAIVSAVNAKCVFDEEEGQTFILRKERAEELGFDASMAMRCITLTVHSALDGVGLTAAVAAALADLAIPCNVVAAFYHDHLFVPAADAELALTALKSLQSGAQHSGAAMPFFKQQP